MEKELEQITYRLQRAQVELHTVITKTKTTEATNKIKHHQLIMNIEYAHEIIKRSVEIAKEAYK